MREFRFALRQTFPIFFTYLFIGIAFGMMMSDHRVRKHIQNHPQDRILYEWPWLQS